MEVALQQRATSRQGRPLTCFNPCFYGSGSTAITADLIRCLSEGFQSLFLWKWLYSLHRRGHNRRDGVVSILVFMEVALQQLCHCLSPCLLFVSILVFMEVALQLGMLTPRVSRNFGFNPCFYGSGSTAKARKTTSRLI